MGGLNGESPTNNPSYLHIVTSERSERSSNYQSYIGRLDDLQTALKVFKKNHKKLKHIFMLILGLAELCKAMCFVGSR